MLLVGAGLFLRSFQQVQSVDLGFGREPTAIMTYLTPPTRSTPDAARVYTRRLLDLLRELPGVEVVGAISNLHLNLLNTSSSDFNVDGFEPATDQGAFIVDLNPPLCQQRAVHLFIPAVAAAAAPRSCGRGPVTSHEPVIGLAAQSRIARPRDPAGGSG